LTFNVTAGLSPACIGCFPCVVLVPYIRRRIAWIAILLGIFWYWMRLGLSYGSCVTQSSPLRLAPGM
jgi:hypothetical protein